MVKKLKPRPCGYHGNHIFFACKSIFGDFFHSVLKIFKGASTPSNIASNIAGNSFHLNSGVQGGDIAGS